MNLFIICILTRIILAYVAKIISIDKLPYLGYITMIPAIGFLYIYFTKSRKTGIEVGGKKIWWNSLRPIHGMLYFMFSIAAINKYNLWYVLLADVIIGIIAYLIHYKIELL